MCCKVVRWHRFWRIEFIQLNNPETLDSPHPAIRWTPVCQGGLNILHLPLLLYPLSSGPHHLLPKPLRWPPAPCQAPFQLCQRDPSRSQIWLWHSLAENPLMRSRVFGIIFKLLGFTHKALQDPPLQLRIPVSHMKPLCQMFPNYLQCSQCVLLNHASVTLGMQVSLLGRCFPCFYPVHSFLSRKLRANVISTGRPSLTPLADLAVGLCIYIPGLL